MAAEADSTMPSVRSWRTIRPRVAPRALRTATSRRRWAALARRRLATLAQAMRSTTATAAIIIQSTVPTSCTWSSSKLPRTGPRSRGWMSSGYAAR
ncbi:MAG: hypothetical protein RJQ04_19505 [Longimicrobiales bacterium]